MSLFPLQETDSTKTPSVAPFEHPKPLQRHMSLFPLAQTDSYISPPPRLIPDHPTHNEKRGGIALTAAALVVEIIGETPSNISPYKRPHKKKTLGPQRQAVNIRTLTVQSNADGQT